MSAVLPFRRKEVVERKWCPIRAAALPSPHSDDFTRDGFRCQRHPHAAVVLKVREQSGFGEMINGK